MYSKMLRSEGQGLEAAKLFCGCVHALSLLISALVTYFGPVTVKSFVLNKIRTVVILHGVAV